MHIKCVCKYNGMPNIRTAWKRITGLLYQTSSYTTEDYSESIAERTAGKICPLTKLQQSVCTMYACRPSFA